MTQKLLLDDVLDPPNGLGGFVDRQPRAVDGERRPVTSEMHAALQGEAYTTRGSRARAHRVRQHIRRKDDHRFQGAFPLHAAGMTKQGVLRWYDKTGEPRPPPSVCDHCWANSTATFRRIAETDPVGWAKSKLYDKEASDLTQFGVKEKTYCSGLRALQELEDRGFPGADGWSDQSCDEGYCFL